MVAEPGTVLPVGSVVPLGTLVPVVSSEATTWHWITGRSSTMPDTWSASNASD